MEFTEFTLHPDLQRGLSEAEYISCMPVQEQVLANAFGGRDLYVQSQTGTGKTAAYLIVIFQRLLQEPLLNGKKALIMVPTRELAVQVEEEAKLIGKYLPFKVGSFYGGVGYGTQTQLLKDHVQILVGTPGRVLDLNSSGQMNLMDTAFLVLDEADRMFDMGFYPDLRKLINVVPPADRRQTMLFSATLNAYVKNLAWEYTREPFEIEIEPQTVTVEEIEQQLYHVPSDDKMKLLMGILQREKPESAVIFCNTKRFTEITAKRLRMNGYECEFIMGDLPQVKRLKIIDNIKAGKIKFLVATDVAARGLDIEGLALVVNYDLPVEAESYVHRIGRTARAGKSGKAITFASDQDVYELPDIEKYIGKKIPAEVASEELYGEDKSEGMRIRTDNYDDRYDDRSDHRSGGRGRPDNRRDDRRESRDHRGERPHGRTRRNDGKTYPENRQRNEKPRTGGKTVPEKNLSALSFEERMAYYKQKYEGSEQTNSAGAGKNPKQNNGSKPAGSKTGNKKRKSSEQPRKEFQGKRNESSGKPTEKFAGQNQSQKQKSRNYQKPQGKSADRNQTAKPAAAPVKKGFFAKLTGFFKGKN
jgi:ATP-dependent RNA helicase RhlB